MAKPTKKKRQGRKRVIETALPKKQYKRTNRLLYVFSGILLVVFGGGAALLGAGQPTGGQPTQAPAVVSSQIGSPAGQTLPAGTTATPAAAAGTATTPAPAAGTSTTPTPAAGTATPAAQGAPTVAPPTPTTQP